MKEEIFEFRNFDLIVGSNNSGKSTALQAMAIWQFCVDQFLISNRRGSKGIQVVLPNFTALPLPEFNLLWTDRLSQTGKNYVYIEIDLYWKTDNNQESNFCVLLRYQSPQAIFAIPKDGWNAFSEKIRLTNFPGIVYVPPFSGLEPHEMWMDDGNVKQQIGKAQPGSVLRNLLYRVIDRTEDSKEENNNWLEIVKKIKDWFGVELSSPNYVKGQSTEIKVEYKVNKKKFDIISAGSGFHQILTLLAFVYGYPEVTTILFDEPDAHLHVNLQRQIVNYFKLKSDKQYIIATHSEEFIKSVELESIVSILSGTPKRVNSNFEIIHALSEIDNIDVVRTQNSPFILYLEGEDDERLLSVWAKILNKTEVYEKFYPYLLGGSTKREMKEKADRHFNALKQMVPNIKRAILLDYDSDEVAINPDEDNINLNEWKRKNIDNYLLVPDVWVRAIANLMGENENSLFIQNYKTLIEDFYQGQNLTLPKGTTWKENKAEIFKVVDGKKLLFESKESLFEKIRLLSGSSVKPDRTTLASNMKYSEIHTDIEQFFINLEKILEQSIPE
ncbi:MAG: ATP-binding protein [Saprospiraceae bacterium]|nr:ATP-binding protein [Saprospiraceae bacterium]